MGVDTFICIFLHFFAYGNVAFFVNCIHPHFKTFAFISASCILVCSILYFCIMLCCMYMHSQLIWYKLHCPVVAFGCIYPTCYIYLHCNAFVSIHLNIHFGALRGLTAFRYILLHLLNAACMSTSILMHVHLYFASCGSSHSTFDAHADSSSRIPHACAVWMHHISNAIRMHTNAIGMRSNASRANALVCVACPECSAPLNAFVCACMHRVSNAAGPECIRM